MQQAYGRASWWLLVARLVNAGVERLVHTRVSDRGMALKSVPLLGLEGLRWCGMGVSQPQKGPAGSRLGWGRCAGRSCDQHATPVQSPPQAVWRSYQACRVLCRRKHATCADWSQ